MKQVWLCCALMMLAQSFVVQAGPDKAAVQSAAVDLSPTQWLERMAHAIQHVNYEGVLVYGDNNKWHTLKVSHSTVNGVEYEKISHLTGKAKELVRSGPADIDSSKSKRLMDPAGKLLAAVDVSSDSFERYYKITLGGRDRVAGRVARKLQVAPLDEYRLGQNLWLDEITGLLLRSDIVDHKSRVLERYQFADVDIGRPIPVPAMSSSSASSGSGQLLENQPDDRIFAAEWGPEWTPPGFIRKKVDNARGQHSAVMFSDGLSAYTVFYDRVEQESLPDFNRRWGATSAVVRHELNDGENLRITVVGEIPMATARQVANSVRYSYDKN